ncbi:MAG: rhodanese-like domain-containing protein [Gracilimonas sp.]|uniref:rhodanese-like domain-containing protein n=1 Tax=Gracilimonas sp. TaxID=1974203 RepID=UPI0019BBAC0F|nr:rhodanese-like domain-containing protein [Gracilimonas sp.]MBD3616795.1 rhodanese-like domain-containing protein [Gracilimonas sp.]
MSATATLRTISAETLNRKLTGNHAPILINALDQEAFLAKHIPGSINIPTENAEIAKEVLPFMDAEIIVYCANSDCTASPELAQKLEEMGYTNVSDFEQGLAGWRKAGYELMGNDV